MAAPIPRAGAPLRPRTRAVHRTAPRPGEPQEVLVVEDDHDLASLLAFVLAREGYEVHHVADAVNLRSFLQTRRAPGLILLDVRLPDGDGIQLLRLIRRQEGWAGVPVLMLTAESNEPRIVEAMEAGADDYVVKPVHRRLLVERVSGLCPIPDAT